MTITVRYDLADEEISDLLALYGDYEWWADRDADGVRRALDATDALVCLEESGTGELVASARVLTDFVYYATVYDVIVADARRGEGLGRRLLDAVAAHPDLQDLSRLTLFSREGLVSFYEECGFERSEMEAPVPERDGAKEDLVYMVYEMARSNE